MVREIGSNTYHVFSTELRGWFYVSVSINLSVMGSSCPALKAAMARIFGLNTFIVAFILVSSQATKPGIRFRITDNGLRYGKSCDFR